MDTTYLIALLFLITLSVVLVFTVVNKAKTEKRLKNDDGPKSNRRKSASKN